MSVLGLSLEYYVGGKRDDFALRRMKVAFERAGSELAQFGRYVFPRVIAILEQEVRGQFRARGRGPHVGKWAPLSPAYAKWKRKRYPGKGILERTGSLKEGLTESSSPFADRSYSAVMMNFGTIGVLHASFHQGGTENGLPARPPIDLTTDFEVKLLKQARLGALEAIKNAGADEFLNLPTGEG